ncbi:MAG: cation:proton antiporter [Thermoanaerobaculia bacterium]|nr:cation:proton antiporter [Thermoanaerobaculia bacterium]MBP9822845.1 cation:proton antiporter [Thermoanaerobaculia bacterium]
MSNFELSIALFLQFAIILAACRLVGFLVRPLGQPQVVAEMITGVLLGPSLFGLLAPGLHAQLFPRESLPIIYSLAQIGLVLYMFLIGLEFDLELIRKRMKSAIFVSWAGIATPFALGALLAWGLMDRFPLFAPGVKVWEAALFMGSAMSITAFPMLARIISERGLSGTALGTLALAAGSLDDAAAWCLLAVVLASFTGKMSIALLALFGGAFYGLFMFTLGRRLLARLFAWLLALPSREPLVLPAALTLLMVAAWATDRLGIYAVFGAFVFGAAMPRGPLQKRLEGQIGPLTAVYLLPMFFINSGLSTKFSLIASPAMLGIAALLLVAAIAGKGIACGVAARLAGESKKDSFAIGALMNARGLMELILLNIGYERGMITQTLFTILVIMAVVTTIMAVPLFNRVYRPGDAAPA